MLNSYTANVPFEIGVKLKEAGYWNPRCSYETSYNSPCYFIHSKKFYDEGTVAPWEEIVPAPTYADVFDWFLSKRGIIITLEPFFTYTFADHTGYTWKIAYPDGEDASMKYITEEDVWKSGPYGGSFGLTADAAIEFAITLGDVHSVVNSSMPTLEEITAKPENTFDSWPNVTNCKRNCKICQAKCLYRKEPYGSFVSVKD